MGHAHGHPWFSSVHEQNNQLITGRIYADGGARMPGFARRGHHPAVANEPVIPGENFPIIGSRRGQGFNGHGLIGVNDEAGPRLGAHRPDAAIGHGRARNQTPLAGVIAGLRALAIADVSSLKEITVHNQGKPIPRRNFGGFQQGGLPLAGTVGIIPAPGNLEAQPRGLRRR